MTAINTAGLFGLGSGLDTQSLISGLVQAESIPIQQLQQQQSTIQSATQAVSTFSSKLSALQSAAQALMTPIGFTSVTAASSDPSIVATASATSATGSFAVNVSSIATEQRTNSNSYASSTTALGVTGTLGITAGGNATVSFSIDPTDTLTDIAAKISTSGARVSANVVYDGSQYHILVRGLDTGATNAVSFTEMGGSVGFGNPANTYQQAQDASLTVDGNSFTSPTNQITGAIPGVTMTLTKPNVSSTITLSTSTSALESKINAFVSAYNDVIRTGHADTGYGTAKASNPLLAVDPGIRASLDRLGPVVGTPVANAQGSFTMLAQVGLHSTIDGTLAFDSSKFEAAMAKDPSSVERLFVTDVSNGSTGAMKVFSDAVDALSLGPTSAIGADLANYQGRTSRIGTQITDMQSRVAAYQQQLQQQFLALDQQVNAYRVQANSLGSLTSTSSGSSNGSGTL